MSSFLLALWAGGGNVNPFLGLAAALEDRGHEVGAVATASLAPRLSAAGIAVVGTSESWLPEAQHLLDGVDGFQPDVVVVDYMMTSALCGAERAGRPTAALVHTLYGELLVDGAPGPIGMAGPVSWLNEVREELDLPPLSGYADLLDAVDLLMVTSARELDDPAELPDRVVHVGPLFEGAGPDASWAPPEGHGPLVVASTGTASDPAAQADLVGRFLLALAPLEVRGLFTLPEYLDPADFVVPANVTLSGYVRHDAVLPHADLVITHAGLGTVSVALAHGVRLVCVPLDREQPDNARAVERLGVGAAVPPDAGPEVIRSAAVDQLAQPAFEPFPSDPAGAAAFLEGLAGQVS